MRNVMHTCVKPAFWVLVRQAGISLKEITRRTQAEATRTTRPETFNRLILFGSFSSNIMEAEIHRKISQN